MLYSLPEISVDHIVRTEIMSYTMINNTDVVDYADYQVPYVDMTADGLQCEVGSSLIFVDWDDTLFPTTWLAALDVDEIDEQMIAKVEEAEDEAMDMLRACMELGKVIFIVII